MKKVLFIALAFIGFNAFSQGMPDPAEMAKKMSEGFTMQMTKELDLSTEQADKVKDYAFKSVTESIEKREMPTIENVTKSFNEQKEAFKKILNAEQFKKYSEEIYPKMLEGSKKRIEAMQNGGGGMGM